LLTHPPQPATLFPTAAPPYAEVVVDVPAAHGEQVFIYAVPPGVDARPGHLVRVPFGPRRARGIVLRRTADLNAPYVKPIAGLAHPQPVLAEVQIALARWIASHYRCSLFEAMAPMLPPGFRTASQSLVRALPGVEVPAGLTPGTLGLLAYLRERPAPHDAAALRKRFGPWVPNALRALLEAGAVERADPPEPTLRVREVQVLRPAVDVPALLAAAEGPLMQSPRQSALARRVAEHAKGYPAADARREFGPNAVQALVHRGLAAIATEPAAHEPVVPIVAQQPSLLPTPAQAAALDAIREAMNAPDVAPRAFLLQGVTGSGKTEVYLQALAHCLSLGKRSIVLVPEISLTPQLLAQFNHRFPGQVGIVHSGLTDAQYRHEWWRCFNGGSGVVIGSRGAIFAPQGDLGLIVLDEEHEWTYKQEESQPRYQARDVALQLARLTGAVVVLGSATPDVASRWHAGRGVYRHLVLPQRIERSGVAVPLADVRLVDMRAELRAGNRGVFSGALQDALRACLAAGNQAVLFLNRRGAASIVECRSCGHVLRCPRCGIAYTYHAGADGLGTLVCHQCNRRRAVPTTCPRCRSRNIRYLGVGTQRIVDEARALLPNARVLRWDRDTAGNARAHEALLDQFASGHADVLVGTQMIAKGLHFPAVTLVGVVLADVGLHEPDYRSSERTFQVLMQVAGRAGRGLDRGKVIVQSYNPEHEAVRAAARQDYEAFYAREIEQREALGNPPFRRLARMVFAHADADVARREAMRMAVALRGEARAWGMGGIDVVGPAPAYPPRSRNGWRWHLLLRGAEPARLLDRVTVPPKWTVDVDPLTTT